MKENVFETEFLDLASKLDAITNSCGDIIKKANMVAENQDHTATIYLVLPTGIVTSESIVYPSLFVV